MSRCPHTRSSADPAPLASGRQCRARTGAAVEATGAPRKRQPDRAESRLVVVVEPDPHVRMLVTLTLGEIAGIVESTSREDALAAMRGAGGNAVHVGPELHLTGTVANLELARDVIARWPGTHMLLTSGFAVLPAEATSRIGVPADSPQHPEPGQAMPTARVS